MFRLEFITRFLFFLITNSLLCLPLFSFADDRSQLFQSFEIEGLSLGLNFRDAVAKAESKNFQLVDTGARELTKKEADGSTKSLIFDMPFIEDEFPDLKIIWRIAYQKKFPKTLNFDPDTVISSLKQKYGNPDKDYQDNQGRHTIIYYRDISKKAEIRFETIKTWRDQVLNVTMSDVNIKISGRTAYNDAKSAEASVRQQSAPNAVIDY